MSWYSALCNFVLCCVVLCCVVLCCVVLCCVVLRIFHNYLFITVLFSLFIFLFFSIFFFFIFLLSSFLLFSFSLCRALAIDCLLPYSRRVGDIATVMNRLRALETTYCPRSGEIVLGKEEEEELSAYREQVCRFRDTRNLKYNAYAPFLLVILSTTLLRWSLFTHYLSFFSVWLWIRFIMWPFSEQFHFELRLIAAVIILS